RFCRTIFIVYVHHIQVALLREYFSRVATGTVVYSIVAVYTGISSTVHAVRAAIAIIVARAFSCSIYRRLAVSFTFAQVVAMLFVAIPAIFRDFDRMCVRRVSRRNMANSDLFRLFRLAAVVATFYY